MISSHDTTGREAFKKSTAYEKLIQKVDETTPFGQTRSRGVIHGRC